MLNPWHLLNLRASPFFQDPLTAVETGNYPISLFVARDREIEEILRHIAGKPSSATAVQGPAGVGKTSLINYVKAEATRHGYLAYPYPISVPAQATELDLRLAILNSAYITLVTHDPGLAKTEVMRDTRQLLDLTRHRALSATVASVGFGTSVSSATGPAAMTVQPESLLRRIAHLTLTDLQLPGIIFHLNNLENASDRDHARAAQLIRDIRDTALLIHGLHYIVGGTDDAIRTIITSQEQLRSIFRNPGSLAPLTFAQFETMLRKRYEYLRHTRDRPQPEPVDVAAIRRLYDAYRGNLRGTLNALEIATSALLGQTGDPTATLTITDIRPILEAVYGREMETHLDAKELSYLEQLREAERPFSRDNASATLGLKPRTAYRRVNALVEKGFLVPISEERETTNTGPKPQLFDLSGSAMIGFGLFSD